MSKYRTDQNYRQALAFLLRTERLKAGLTQEELAKRMETRQSAIARIEGGSENPSLTTLLKMADAIGKGLTIEFTTYAPDQVSSVVARSETDG